MQSTRNRHRSFIFGGLYILRDCWWWLGLQPVGFTSRYDSWCYFAQEEPLPKTDRVLAGPYSLDNAKTPPRARVAHDDMISRDVL